MEDRVEEIRKLVEKSKENALCHIKKKREKREKRGVTNRTPKINKKSDVYEIAEVYVFLYEKNYKVKPPIFGRRELGQFKNLITKLDADRAEKLVRYVFANWSWISREIGLSGVPVIGDILARCMRYAIPEEKKINNEKKDFLEF